MQMFSAAGVIDILDPFETTKNTTLQRISGYSTNGSDGAIIYLEFRVRLVSTAAVTEINYYFSAEALPT
jgi:hypothetical protein